MIHQSDNRAVITRLGHKMIYTSVNGWNLGVDVKASKLDDGRVAFKVWQTGGSNGNSEKKLLAEIEEPKTEENIETGKYRRWMAGSL